MSLLALGFALISLDVLFHRWREPGYAMPIAVVMVAATGVVLTAAGGTIAIYRGEALRPWMALLTTLLFLAAVVTALSIGPLLLLAAIVSLVLRLRLREPRAMASRFGVGAGFLLSLGLAPEVGLVIEPPVVACMNDGASTGTPIWTQFGTHAHFRSSGASSSSDSRATFGTVTTRTTTYRYTCTGGALVAFDAS